MSTENFPFDLNTRKYVRHNPPFHVGSKRQLFFDDFLLSMAPPDRPDQLAFGVRFSLGKAKKHGSPLELDKGPWETGYAWFSVLREDSLYRMWYNSNHRDRRGLRVSYAESDDGIKWRKPKLGMVDVAGSTDNNVVFAGGYGGSSQELGCVFKDTNAYPGEEYKMIYSDWIDRELFEAHPADIEYNGALRGASSPDGLHWKRYTKNFWNHYADSQNTASWDSTLGRYVIYHRCGSQFAGLDAGPLQVVSQSRGRAIGRMDSYDFFRDWSSSEVAVSADMEDGLDTDIYTSAYSRHPDNPNVHYLFPAFYRHHAGIFEIQVCTSRDNINWQRVCRDTFIPLGAPGEFDCFIISVAPSFIPIGNDEWALYYRSGDGPHGGARPITLDYKPESRISRVTFKQERIVGIEGGAAGGRFTTRPLAFTGNRLRINVEPTGPDPELKVQLLSGESRDPIPGYSFEECRPIDSDSVAAQLSWRDSSLGAEVPRTGVRLHFSLRSMRVYSFQFCD